jgi:hypothetical protein
MWTNLAVDGHRTPTETALNIVARIEISKQSISCAITRSSIPLRRIV